MQRNVATIYTITNVSRISKISPRRLAYWDSIGLVKPSLGKASGRGSRRFYSFQDIARIKIVMELLDAGFSLQRIHRSFTFIDSLQIPISELVILTDTDTIYVCQSKDIFVDTLRHGQTVLKLVVADLLKEVEQEIQASDMLE